VEEREASGQGQAEAGAGLLPSHAGIHLLELSEDPLLVGRRNPDPTVANVDLERVG
jgi:hypothetical protein